MKITLEDEHGKYTIEREVSYATIHSYFEDLIIPVLRAAGFSQEVIDKYLED